MSQGGRKGERERGERRKEREGKGGRREGGKGRGGRKSGSREQEERMSRGRRKIMRIAVRIEASSGASHLLHDITSFCFMMHRYTLMINCWRPRGEDRPNFTTVFSQLRDIYSKYTAFVDNQYGPPLNTPELNFSTFGKNLHEEKPPTINIDRATRASSTGYRSGTFPGQYRSGGGYPRGSRDGEMPGRSPQSIRKGSQTLPENLSLTFSVLSKDVLSGSESDTETEKSSQVMGFDLNLLPALFTKESTPGAGDATDSAMELMSSVLRTTSTSTSQQPSSSTAGDNLLFSSRPVETELLPPTPSLSPDLTSKTSTVGDETISTASGNTATLPTEANINQANADTISKASTLDSLSTTLSAHYCSPNLTSATHNGTEDQKPRDRSPLMVDHKARVNGHSTVSEPGRASKSTDSGIRSDEEQDTVHVEPEANTTANGDNHNHTVAAESESMAVNGDHAGVVRRSPVGKQESHLSEVSRDSRTSQASFGLGISDLSSELMSTFELWSTK